MRCFAHPSLLIIAVNLCLLPPLQAQLGEALNTNLIWTTTGATEPYQWTAQRFRTHDGDWAARAGRLDSLHPTSTLETTVTGPGTLTFWWTSFSPYGLDTLYFSSGGSTQAVLTATTSTNWRHQTVYIGSGVQTLAWTTVYSGSGSWADSYLDEVGFTQGPTLPFIAGQPRSQSQIRGLKTTFRVMADGTPPLQYQWQFNALDIPDATNSSLSIPFTCSTNLGIYRVVITNSFGSITSSNAVLEMGDVTAWGSSSANQTFVPPGATNVLALAAGRDFSVALKSDRTVMVWGDNSLAQQDIPSDATNLISIAAGEGHVVALKADGRVIAWGLNSYGQTNVPPGLSNVVQIAAGTGHSIALKSDGSLVVWGATGSGLASIPPQATNIVFVAAGYTHAVAIRADGSLLGWGYDYYGQASVPPGLSNVQTVAVGSLHSMALKEDGSVAAWGIPAFGITNVPSSLTNAVAISAGHGHSMALTADRRILEWGITDEGSINASISDVPATLIAAGPNHSVAAITSRPVLQRAAISDPVISAQGFHLTVASQSGRVYALEFSDSLTALTWQALPLTAGTGENLTLHDHSASTTQRYYRVKRW